MSRFGLPDFKAATRGLDDATIRDFSGGWNVIDNDLNLSSRYSKVLRNFVRSEDNAIQIRYGTRLFSRCEDALESDIVNMAYHSQSIISVGTNGYLSKTDGTGTSVRIWDNDIASLLPDAPTGWGTTDFVSFAQASGDLTVHNGVDKPLIVSPTLTVDYLNDPSTGSNSNVPIGKYACNVDEYLIIAGIGGEESTIYISGQGTPGVWPGDVDTDAITLDLASRVPSGSVVIRGLANYHNVLYVFFDQCVIPIKLGTYDSDDNHVPTVNNDDIITEIGTVGHNTLNTSKDKLYSLDVNGIAVIQPTKFTANIESDRPSELVDPAIQMAIGNSTLARLEKSVFSINNSKAHQFYTFIPDDSYEAGTIYTKGFLYTAIRSTKEQSWSELDGWKWNCATRSELGRIFFARGSDIFVYGSLLDPIYADYVGDEETFSDGTTFTDQTGLTPVADEEDSGIPIKFAWELPWADFKNRRVGKTSKYIALDTKGDARFTIKMFVNNIYLDKTDLGEEFTDGTSFDDDFGFIRDEPELDPTLEMEMVGGDHGGFGLDFGVDFGGGRNTGDERLFRWPSKFRIAKLRIDGESMRPLKIVSLTMFYKSGNIRMI